MANFMRGSNGADALNGGDGNDTIYTFATNSTVGGDDTVHGGQWQRHHYMWEGMSHPMCTVMPVTITIYLSYGAHPTYARGGTGNDIYHHQCSEPDEEFAGEGIDTIRTTVTMSFANPEKW